MTRAVGVLLWVAAFAAAPAMAQTVYRCAAQASAAYSDAACPGAQAQPPVRRPSAAEVADAKKVAKDDARLAEQLANERRAREAASVKGAAGFHTAPKPAKPGKPVPASNKPSKKKKAGTSAAAG